jgi:hypothetical protein
MKGVCAMDGVELEQFEVFVIYNGVTKPFTVRFTELVRKLLDQARSAFGIHQNPHLLGLFTPDNRELNDNDTIKTAGVHPEEKLNLRPSAVRGGNV